MQLQQTSHSCCGIQVYRKHVRICIHTYTCIYVCLCVCPLVGGISTKLHCEGEARWSLSKSWYHFPLPLPQWGCPVLHLWERNHYRLHNTARTEQGRLIFMYLWCVFHANCTIQAITDTANSHVKQNRPCLEQCLKKLARALDSFVVREINYTAECSGSISACNNLYFNITEQFDA